MDFSLSLDLITPPGRHSHSSVAISDSTKTVNQIVVMGGLDDTQSVRQDIWKSVDGGVTWSNVGVAGWTG
jgi:hypothetical protein